MGKTLPSSLHAVDKIIVLTECPLTQRDYVRFGVPVFLASGLDTEVWDLSFLVRPHTVSTPSNQPVRRLASKAEFRSRLAALPAKRVLVVSFLSYGLKTWTYLAAISRAGIPYVLSVSAMMPMGRVTRLSLWRRLRNLRLWPLLEQMFSTIKPSLLGLTPPRIVLVCGGSQARPRAEWCGENTEIIRGHAHDYDIYLACREKQDAPSQPIAVFLDEYLPFHPDYARHRLVPFVTPGAYFSSLNRYFDALEKLHGLRVIIAGHPRSEYEKHGDCFAGRAVIKHQTATLVRDANLVLMHSSTSVLFAALFAKPVIFLTSDELERSPEGGYVLAMAGEFEQSPVNVDHFGHGDRLGLEMETVGPLHARYVDRYVKSKGTADKPCWQFLVDNIRGR